MYPEASLSTSTAYEWFSKFAAGDCNLQDEPCLGCPSFDSMLKAILKADPHQTTTDLARKLGCHQTTVANHLYVMGMVRKLDRWVPHQLLERNKIQHATICASLLSQFNEEPFFGWLVTSNKKWILWDNQRHAYAWLELNKLPCKVPKIDLHPHKLLLCIW